MAATASDQRTPRRKLLRRKIPLRAPVKSSASGSVLAAEARNSCTGPKDKSGSTSCRRGPFLTRGPARYPPAMSTSPLSPDEIRAAAEVHAELGADYHDAVMESFLAKVDREIDARVDARLAAERRIKTPDPRLTAAGQQRAWTTGLAIGLIGGTVAAGFPLTILLKHVAHEGAFSSNWKDSLWIIWVTLAVVYIGGAAVVATHNRHKRQLARAAAQGQDTKTTHPRQRPVQFLG